MLHLVRSSWPVIGGLEASVHGLASRQVASGWRVTVASPTAPAEVRDGVTYRPLRAVGPRRYPFARGLPALLDDADIVHVHGLDGLADQAVRLHPLVGISTHGGYFHTPRHPWLKRVMVRTWTRRTLRRAAAVWFTSESDRAQLASARVDGVVVGDGVDVDALARVPRAPVPGRWVVPGRVDVHKGLDDLAWWLGALGDDGPDEVRVVGPCTRPELAASLEAAGLRVTGPRPRDAWLREVASADLVVLPSRFEGFGITAVEVMAMGVPVVLSDIAAHRELDVADPVARVDFRARPEMAEAQRRWRGADPVRWVSARQASVARHDWPRVAARFDAAYDAMRPS